MNKPTDYRHIKAWGEMLGSMPYYIKDQQERAANDNAPLNATYQDNGGNWRTSDQIVAQDTREYIESRAI